MSRILTYGHLQTDIAELLRQARGLVVRSVNAVITACYWEDGRRTVKAEKKGKHLAVDSPDAVWRIEYASQFNHSDAGQMHMRLNGAEQLTDELRKTSAQFVQGRKA